MRFSNIHVDGFGTLSNRDIGPLRDGLNIVLGENESGKSTLLDFVRGVLYGFVDRRSPRNFREPLSGGRHGGSISLRDGSGSSWTIVRHVGGTLSITGDSGASASPEELSKLLGHTDRKVFESIFAFGLDELAEAERLHDENVRDLIFSAGVAGAGRSASHAIRRLDAERAEITRNSRSQGQTNHLAQLIRERDDCQEQLRRAQTQSNSYIVLQREIERLDRSAKSLFARISEREIRRQELSDLGDADAALQRRLAFVHDLALLPEPSSPKMQLAGLRPSIAALAIRAESYQRDVAEHDRLSQETTNLRATIETLRDRIGLKQNQRGPTTITIGLQSEIEDLQREFESIRLDIHTQSDIFKRAEEELGRQRAIVSDLTRDRNPDEFDDVSTRLVDLSTLRAMLSSSRELALEAQLASRDRQQPERPLTTLDRTIAVILGIMALSGLVAAGAHLTTPSHDSLFVALVGVAVFLVASTGLVLLLRQAHRLSAKPPHEKESTERDATEELFERIAERARALGLPSRPTDAELDELETQLTERAQAAAQIKHAIDSEAQCNEQFNAAHGELARSESIRVELCARAARYCDELGIDRHVEPDVLVKIIESFASLVELEANLENGLARLAELKMLIDTYESELHSLCHEIGRPMPDRARCAPFLAEVLEEAELSQTQMDARESIVAEIAMIDEILASLIDRGGAGERLRDELEHGSGAERELERAALGQELAQITSEIEQIVGQRRDLQNELDALSSSSSIAELEIRLSTIIIEINEIFERWALLTLSSSLLKEALNRYEIERQPAVIELAGGLFAQVTENRYVRLISHEDDQQRQSLRVIQSDGDSFDALFLSKGTAEQLYLCVRLAYAMTFAERAVAMPLVFDDVLVNFDPTRCQQMARAIATVSQQHQVILFTCHPEVAKILQGVSSQANIITLDRQA